MCVIDACGKYIGDINSLKLKDMNDNSNELSTAHKIKAKFIAYFDSVVSITPNTFQMGVCKLDYDDNSNTLTVHLRRPGLLIGTAGATLNALKEHLNCNIQIIEVLLGETDTVKLQVGKQGTRLKKTDLIIPTMQPNIRVGSKVVFVDGSYTMSLVDGQLTKKLLGLSNEIYDVVAINVPCPSDTECIDDVLLHSNNCIVHDASDNSYHFCSHLNIRSIKGIESDAPYTLKGADYDL